MTNKIYMQLFLIVFFLGANNAHSARSYHDVYTPEGRVSSGMNGIMPVDNFIWVMSGSFAKRWSMPMEWVDLSMDGALAFAFKVQQSDEKKCGYFRNYNNCRSENLCILEAYFDSNAKIPWRTDRKRDFCERCTDSSVKRLAGQKSDHFMWNEKEQRISHDHTFSHIGFKWVFFDSQNNSFVNSIKPLFTESMNRRNKGGSGYILSYIRDYRGKGFDTISMKLNCEKLSQSYKYDHTRLVFVEDADEQKYPKSEGYKWGISNLETDEVYYESTIPKSYLKQIHDLYENYKKEHKVKDLYQEAAERGIVPKKPANQ
ncbi:hypothetical protein [Thiomicrorhabdus sp. Kp2]|uniref:hypothetical protein n=1 Tax=Thiomicrorhabdus sp. Kp2 TaxID=1123518 RepID=UPI00059504A0|nr:hypothetical protein [Thiomicrorhabdus sp. Kp2]